MTIAVTANKRTQDGLTVQVQLSDAAAGCALHAQATLTTGEPLPVRLVARGTDDTWSYLLPALSVTQVLTLSAQDDRGVLVEQQKTKLNPLATRLSMPVDLRLRARRQEVELPDPQVGLDDWDIHVDRLIRTADDWEVCQGWMRLISAHRQSVEGKLSVRVLDARGHDAANGAWVCLADEVAALDERTGFSLRYIEFSVRVQQADTALVVCVEPAKNTLLPCGFACLGPRATARLREAWKETSTSARDDQAYDVWFTQNHAARETDLAMQRVAAEERGPLFSLVCVARSATATELRATVESVLAQSYGHFELLLVNAMPSDHKLGEALRMLDLLDARVRSVPLAADFGVAAATSAGVDAATGDYVGLVGEGDLLAPDALWHLATVIEEDGRRDVVYTDEDCWEHGRHVRPLFKPDWDCDLLLGTNYLGGLMVMRTSLLDEMEPMGHDLDGAQAYELALYATRRARRVFHMPRVLYHAGTVASPRTTAVTALGLTALRKHLDEMGVRATARVSARVPQGLEVSYDLPEEQPLVSVIVLNRDNTAALDRFLTSLHAHTAYERYEVIIVENGSSDPTTFSYYAQAEQADPRVHTIFYQEETDFDEVLLINFGATRAKGELLLLAHNDIELTDDAWMGRLVGLCLREGTGAAGVRLVRADGTIESCGESLTFEGPMVLDQYRILSDVREPQQSLLHATTLASGACLMVDRAAFDEVGGLSAAFAREGGIADLCLRLWGHGYRVVVDPQVNVVHHRPLASMHMGVSCTTGLRMVGRLWESWPFGEQTYDPVLGPNVDNLSAYRALPL